MVSKNVHFMIIFEEEWPIGAIKDGILSRWFDRERLLGFNLFFDFFLDNLSALLLIFSHGLLNKKLWKVIIFILIALFD